MAFHLVLEALARIEHKLDIIVRRSFRDDGFHPQMQFTSSTCPVCRTQVTYRLDLEHQVAVRKCGCKTGLVPTTFKINPVPQQGEVKDGTAAPDQARGRTASRPENGPRGEES